MPRRRGARRNPTGTQWALIGGGVAITGIVAYLIYKSSSSATPQPAPAQVTTTTPSPVLTPPVVAPPPAHLMTTVLPHNISLTPHTPAVARYSQTFVEGSTISLVVGDTVQLLPPAALTNSAWRWSFQVPDTNVLQTFANAGNTAGGRVSTNEGDFKAVAPGRTQVTCYQSNPTG